ncbi:MAG: hypothetical protein K6U00_09465 [Armatimonadetes bacterium]|nr:hypothetical protein [Armatimonadota bacterium]
MQNSRSKQFIYRPGRRKRAIRSVVLSIAFLVSTLYECLADSADVSLPGYVGFIVQDVHEPTSGNPNPSTLSFQDAELTAGGALRIGVRAAADYFTKPSSEGDAIPVSSVTWSVESCTNGIGYPGSLDASSFTTVYQSNPDVSAGSIDLNWTLAQLTGISLRAGMHSVSATWKIECIVP